MKKVKSRPRLQAKPPSQFDFSCGIKPPLRAKSKGYGDTTLSDHLIEAASMALSASESTLMFDLDREQVRIAVFTAGLFHDIGKAAAGFQEMIKLDEIGKWPPHEGGYRHEILSAVILISNLTKLEHWRKNTILLQAVYLAVVTHHKPFKENTNQYPKNIDQGQWPGGGAFRQMYQELLLNQTLLQESWSEIIEVLNGDEWTKMLLDRNWLPLQIDIPDINQVITDFNAFNTIPGYENGIIISSKLQINKKDVLLFYLVRSLLIVGDHLSSGGNFYIPPTPYLEKYSIFKDNHKLRQFQLHVKSIKNSILLRAPTGSGKTEAAFAWLQSNQLNTVNGVDELSKIFYVLPVQASINAMYKRFNVWMESQGGLVGLQHSRSSTTLYSIIEDEIYEKKLSNKEKKEKLDDFIDPWTDLNVKTVEKIKFTSFLNKYKTNKKVSKKSIDKKQNKAAKNLSHLTREIFYPIKITTPHQLLKATLQGRGWEAQLSDLHQSCIVFDEIHAYDPHLTGLILGLAKTLIQKYNSRILFMSASFPTLLIDLIHQNVDKQLPLITLNPEKPEDLKLLELKRHRLDIKDYIISEDCDKPDFIEEIDKHPSVLIICNTVSSSQVVYRKLKPVIETKYGSNSIILIHSRFRIKDRRTKEELVMKINDEENTIRVVISTQVVEASLNIDLSFGIFEAAPLDALVQRFGRINRTGKNKKLEKENIWICKSDNYSHLIYSPDITTYSVELLQRIKHKPISENDLVGLIDELYTKHGWTEEQKTDFHRAMNHASGTDFFSNLRPGSYKKWHDLVILSKDVIDVILLQDLSEYQLYRKKNSLRADELIIPVRISDSSRLDYNNNINDYLPILKTYQNYDSDIGLQL
ncbi:MAG: CRISPR-associated helicase Cas3' [Candidatus Heimdallarchaeota archaeon]|nr:CRISPR-associated helicase Cas3' [Candidatus Heimdallarchaeota archaeon]MDH5645345.1 CRISPR-associated helicase Cas3' [Candidatus Heimdallarchaeota archaeon]